VWPDDEPANEQVNMLTILAHNPAASMLPEKARLCMFLQVLGIALMDS
jgi:hypothetical protein